MYVAKVGDFYCSFGETGAVNYHLDSSGATGFEDLSTLATVVEYHRVEGADIERADDAVPFVPPTVEDEELEPDADTI